MSRALATLEDPFQHAAVLAVPRPEELPLFVGAEPVHVIDIGKLGVRMGADLEIVGKVIAHVVAEEGEHGHWVTAKFSNFAGRRCGGFTAGACSEKCSVL